MRAEEAPTHKHLTSAETRSMSAVRRSAPTSASRKRQDTNEANYANDASDAKMDANDANDAKMGGGTSL